jgi:hypothetical protein
MKSFSDWIDDHPLTATVLLMIASVVVTVGMVLFFDYLEALA